MTDLLRVPLDVDAIAARADAAPAGYWVEFPDSVFIPWGADDDAPQVSAWDHGRYIAIQDNDWYGTEEPLAELWAFLAAARDDVLSLAAEVRRLRAAASEPAALWRHVATLTAWLDAANPRTDHEVACRVMKLAEETGEAVAAYIGMTGQNPRKGTCATLDDLTAELCDVIVTAMVALATVTGNADGAETRLQQHVAARFARLIERIGSDPHRIGAH
jgi:hypothetical protein